MDDQIIGNRYQIVDRIGSGGMGTVYAAFDRLTGDTVALKRVTLANEESRPTTDSLDGNGSFTLRLALAEEFKTLASLRHPYIISVLDYGFDDDQHPYLIMDLLENARPLNQAAAGQSLDVRVEYLVQTLQAVAYLHRR
ncbi:MAG: serine/threonine-protein kinase PknK, partial [Anaerolineae bacterium]|nr:serine/threonine-protein kinase PknK [Anaerolineae bacterium]